MWTMGLWARVENWCVSWPGKLILASAYMGILFTAYLMPTWLLLPITVVLTAVFFTLLIVYTKSLNDAPPKNE